ncbi:DUF6090 family protein [Bizionia paragorgiae]|uniref:DUF6090 family protein n=1 Tax=Bizionia paragorgiae TaxID=283786 RepID=UPI003A8CB5EC
MIKFFRKIRQNLLSENKFSKYLIYAIGEIVLVVIGILIALSLNNWNENLKSIKEEKEILNNIYKDLSTDSIQFDYYESQFQKIETLHLQLYKVGIKNEELDSISEPALIRRSLYFKQLIDSDFEKKAHTIENSKIREALILYTKTIADLETVYEIELLPLINKKLKNYLAEKELYNVKNWFELKSRTFDDYSYDEINGKNLVDKDGLIELAKTKKFQQMLFELNVKWNDFHTRLMIVINENYKLRDLIRQELKEY